MQCQYRWLFRAWYHLASTWFHLFSSGSVTPWRRGITATHITFYNQNWAGCFLYFWCHAWVANQLRMFGASSLTLPPTGRLLSKHLVKFKSVYLWLFQHLEKSTHWIRVSVNLQHSLAVKQKEDRNKPVTAVETDRSLERRRTMAML